MAFAIWVNKNYIKQPCIYNIDGIEGFWSLPDTGLTSTVEFPRPISFSI